MKVRCLYNLGESLSEYTRKHAGYFNAAKFPINIGDLYNVYGQIIFKGVLEYLIRGAGENYPSWYPAELFEVVDTQLYLDWHFKYDRDNDISAIWGFQELVEDENFLYELEDRNKKAIETFLERKHEIDEFLD